MNALTIVNTINQKLQKYEVLKPHDPVAIRFRFFRQESRWSMVIDSGFKVQVVEDNVLEIQNNNKSTLIDTKNVILIEFISSIYLKDQDL